MPEHLSVLEAYKSMFVFIKNYYYRIGKPAEIGGLLSDIQLIADGKPQDPAMWQDWLDAIAETTNEQKD
jgi:hypothetical protein